MSYRCCYGLLRDSECVVADEIREKSEALYADSATMRDADDEFIASLTPPTDEEFAAFDAAFRARSRS